MKGEKVVITGMGIASSVGLTPEDCWRNLTNRKCLTKHDTRLQGSSIKISCPISEFSAEKYLNKSIIWRSDLFIQYGLYAAQKAIDDAQLNISINNKRTGIILGNSLAGISSIEKLKDRVMDEGIASISSSYILSTMGNMVCGNIAIELGITGPTYLINTACASGSDAIGMAKRLIEQGLCDIVLAGATEAPITPLIVSLFSKIGALSKNSDLTQASRPFDRDRDGFVISEGAAVLVLESESHAITRKARIYATLAGYGSVNDAYHITSPSPKGAGIRESINKALSDANLSPENIDAINAHGTATQLNDRTESSAISDIFGNDVYVTSTKGSTGHALAASGAIEAVFSILKIVHHQIPPVAGLKQQDENINIKVAHTLVENKMINAVVSNSLGFGGQNATLVFTKYI